MVKPRNVLTLLRSGSGGRVRLKVEGSLVIDPTEALCYFLSEQDTFSSA